MQVPPDTFDGIDPTLDEELLATEGALIAIEQKVVDYLAALPQFAPIVRDILIEDLETLPQKLEEANQGIAPLMLIVRVLAASDKSPATPALLRLDPLTIEVRVLENPITNRGAAGTHISRNKCAELVALALKLRRVGNSYLALSAIDDVEVNRDNLLAKAVTFTLSADIQ